MRIIYFLNHEFPNKPRKLVTIRINLIRLEKKYLDTLNVGFQDIELHKPLFATEVVTFLEQNHFQMPCFTENKFTSFSVYFYGYLITFFIVKENIKFLYFFCKINIFSVK